jgi:hypothetical protein
VRRLPEGERPQWYLAGAGGPDATSRHQGGFLVPPELARDGDGIGALLLIGPVGPADIVAAVQRVLAE